MQRKQNLMQISYYGHSCVGLVCGENEILIDPFITPNPQSSHILLKDIKAKWILVTHGHDDHIADLEALLIQNNATLICNHEIANWYQKKGYQHIMGMNIGGSITIGETTIHMTSALHSSSLPDGSYGGNPAGFVVSHANKNCYFAGDTGLSAEMSVLAQQFTLNASFLPIGDRYTMGYKDALLASKMLETEMTIGMHYNTFEALNIDTQAAQQYFIDNNKKLTLLEVGDKIEL